MTENIETGEEGLQPEGLMFDQKLKTLLSEACRAALLQVPELRSVVVGFDYRGGLNDAPTITKGLWISGEGSKKSADTVVGTLGMMVHMLANIVDASMDLHANIAQQITEASRLLLERRNELDRIETGIGEIRGGQAVSSDAAATDPGSPED